MKKVHINYPKKKVRIHPEDVQGIEEPQRQTMYDVLLENLRLAKRASFLHRIIYVGEHKFKDLDDLVKLFESIVKRANDTYCIERLSGFFVYYTKKYFIHMVEGDEDNINKHLGYLLNKSAPHAVNLGMIKLLIHVSHVNQRFTDEWVVYNGVPSKLLETIEVSSDLEKSGRYIYNCIKKVYTLIWNVVGDLETKPKLDPECSTTSIAQNSETIDQDTPRSYTGMPKGASQVIDLPAGSPSMQPAMFGSAARVTAFSSANIGLGRDKYSKYLPEFEFLDFVLGSEFTMTLQSYYELYGVVPMRDIYTDRVWPVPSDFIPYDIFDKPYECVTELVPKKKEKSDKPALMAERSLSGQENSKQQLPPKPSLQSEQQSEQQAET